MNMTGRASALASLLLLASATCPSTGYAQDSAARYTFSWPIDGVALKPPASVKEAPEVLKDQAAKLAAALG